MSVLQTQRHERPSGHLTLQQIELVPQRSGRPLRATLAQAGVRQDRVRFCLKRPEKRNHCAAIGATHFVDDRLDVLEHLAGLVPRLYWFGHQAGTPSIPEWAQPVRDWSAARGLILSQL
jgi:hypothetical protein